MDLQAWRCNAGRIRQTQVALGQARFGGSYSDLPRRDSSVVFQSIFVTNHEKTTSQIFTGLRWETAGFRAGRTGTRRRTVRDSPIESMASYRPQDRPLTRSI